MTCRSCGTDRPASELILVACIPHAGEHAYLVCRPTLPDQDERGGWSCFRQEVGPASTWAIAAA